MNTDKTTSGKVLSIMNRVKAVKEEVVVPRKSDKEKLAHRMVEMLQELELIQGCIYDLHIDEIIPGVSVENFMGRFDMMLDGMDSLCDMMDPPNDDDVDSAS